MNETTPYGFTLQKYSIAAAAGREVLLLPDGRGTAATEREGNCCCRSEGVLLQLNGRGTAATEREGFCCFRTGGVQLQLNGRGTAATEREGYCCS